MPEIKEVLIDNLQPTDIDLSPSTLEYYSNTFPLLRDSPTPEVWEIDGELLLADGHHQLYDRQVRIKKNTARVVYNTPETCEVSSAAYQFVISILREKVEFTKRNRVYSIRDMKIKTSIP